MRLKTTVIVPVCNAETTIHLALNSLLRQKYCFDELIIINDGSIDKSIDIAKKILANTHRKNAFKIRFIDHEISLGLAASYNEAINYASSELVVILHADMELLPNSLEMLVSPFLNKINDVVATTNVTIYPFEIWNKYNFWEKAFFARFVGKKINGIVTGQFNCFSKMALIKIGLYDDLHFKTAGEDGNLAYRLKKIGKIIDSSAEVIHVHKYDQKFSYLDIVKKHIQYSEAFGVNLRYGKIGSIKDHIMVFFREILLISLFIPNLNILAVFAIIIYSFLYTGQMYLSEWRDRRILLLPILNICLLFICTFSSIKGFIKAKQET